MTGGRTRPTHDDLEIETLISTISTGEQTPKLTVEQRAIGALCHELLSIAEVSAHLIFPWVSCASWSVTWPTSSSSSSTGRPTLAIVPTWPCWSGCWTGCAPPDEDFGLPVSGGIAGATEQRVADNMDATSLRQRLRGVPAPVLDVGLAVALAVAVTIGIRVAPGPGTQPDVFAYACGLIIAALALARRRWPLAVLLASSATLQVYYLSNYTSTYPAVPLSVALATAWAAGHRRWSLLIATWFVVGPLAYAVSQLSAQTEPPLPLLGEAVTNTAMLAAVLVLGEAVRSRRARALEQERSERLLLNVLPAPIATRLKPARR
jgi:hypothetical protein